ncbi:DUF2497 domain-containing protein [Candidatus Neoehrlichia procyonis]|uniref:DUF2497 domain-containing protein n=1 Tax=Candidatus Neoehrlichia procyonis str. RAC413 TaxID=1359163 RepID=A0A0F3NP11_9RICK|nr:DUF2497 domain-containing protein [Candidatus Neoehrlichia lotoris]KJV69506.1 hypothetical protein NLO413_0899 [Candidatus Neoehrlichia lotoris str. RAC413]
MSDESSNFLSIKDIINGIKKIMASSDKQIEQNTEIIHLENPENVLELNKHNFDPYSILSSIDNTLRSIIEQTTNQHNIKSNTTAIDASTYDNNSSINNPSEFLKSMNLTENSSLTIQENASKTQHDITNFSLISEKNITTTTEEIKKLINQIHKSQKPVNNSNITIEELIINILKPELSKWLNKNLHKLVKNIIEKEISQLINNARSQ